MSTNHKKCADSEYQNEKLDLKTIFAFFEDFRFFFMFLPKNRSKILKKNVIYIFGIFDFFMIFPVIFMAIEEKKFFDHGLYI